MTTITISDRGGATFAGFFGVQLASGAPTSNLASNDSVDVAFNDNVGTLLPVGIPSVPGAIVSAASIETVNGFGNACTISIYACKRNQVNNQETWNAYSTGNNWATAGAGNRSTDTDATALLTHTFSTGPSNDPVSLSSAGLIAWVQDVMNGNRSNFGLTIEVDSTGDAFFHYPNSNYIADATIRPQLTVTYTVGTPVSQDDCVCSLM